MVPPTPATDFNSPSGVNLSPSWRMMKAASIAEMVHCRLSGRSAASSVSSRGNALATAANREAVCGERRLSSTTLSRKRLHSRASAGRSCMWSLSTVFDPLRPSQAAIYQQQTCERQCERLLQQATLHLGRCDRAFPSVVEHVNGQRRNAHRQASWLLEEVKFAPAPHDEGQIAQVVIRSGLQVLHVSPSLKAAQEHKWEAGGGHLASGPRSNRKRKRAGNDE